MLNNNTINSLTRKEAELVARMAYEKKDIVTSGDLDTYLPRDYPYRRKLVYSLKKKKLLIPVKNGVYIFVLLEAVSTGRRISEFLIASVFFPRGGCYIGYSIMYNYYNFTNQQFQTVYVLNTRISRERTIAGLSFKFVKIPPERLYGLEEIDVNGKKAVISDRERTLVDLMYFNEPVGGTNAAMDILMKTVQTGQCDVRKLIAYSVKFPIIKTRKLIGFALEKAGVNEKMLIPLIKSVQKTSLISFTGSRKGQINEKWRVIVPVA